MVVGQSFSSNATSSEFRKTNRVPYHVIPSGARNLTIEARVTSVSPNTLTSSAWRHFRLKGVIFRAFERSLASLGMTTPRQIRSSSKSYTSNQ
jgi:hypothetical protein